MRRPDRQPELEDVARRRPPETPAVTTPPPRRVAEVLALQQSAGNHAVARMLQRRIIPVYDRAPESDESKRQDQYEVDTFAESATNVPNAAPIVNDLVTGGSLADIQLPETIVVTGHGNVGTLQGYSGSEVAGMLKDNWKLPQAYSGTLRINSCKAGDKGGWINPSSLIEDISNALQGYQVTLEGLSGNVVVPPRGTARPGVPRSIASDEGYQQYLYVSKLWTKLQRAYDAALSRGPVADARQLAQSAEFQIAVLEFELKKYPQSSSFAASFVDLLSGTRSEVQRITGEIAARKKEAVAHRATEQLERNEVDKLYLPQIQAALKRLDTFGVPFGDPSVTVTHGPADRAPKPAAAGGWTSPNAWIAYFSGGTVSPAQ